MVEGIEELMQRIYLRDVERRGFSVRAFGFSGVIPALNAIVSFHGLRRGKESSSMACFFEGMVRVPSRISSSRIGKPMWDGQQFGDTYSSVGLLFLLSTEACTVLQA